MSHSFGRMVLEKSSQALLIKAAGAGISFLMFAALARAMSPNAYGVFGTAFSLVTLLGVIGSMGQRGVVLKFAAAYDESGQRDLLRGVFRAGYVQVLVGCVVVGVAGATYFYWSVDSSVAAAAGVLVLALSMGMVEFQAIAFRSNGGLLLTLVPRDLVWRGFVTLAALLSLLIFGKSRDSSVEWIWLFALGLAVVGTVQLGLFSRATNLLRGPSDFDREAWRQPRVGLWISSATMAATPGIAVLLVQRLVSTSDAGPFFAAMRTSQLLNLLLLASTVVATPLLSRTLSRSDRQASQTVVSVTAFASGAFGAVGFLFMVLFGRHVLGIFGSHFGSAYVVLLVMASGFLVNTVAGPTGALLEMSGGQNVYSLLLVAFNGVSLGLMPVAVGAWGDVGAAVCVAFASAGWNVVAWIYCRRAYGIDPTMFSAYALIRKFVGKSVRRGAVES